MFELFTEKAKEVVALAQKEVFEIGYRTVGTEDFLLGLIGAKPGFVTQTLNSEGLNLGNVRKAAKQFRRRDENVGAVEFQAVGDTYSRVTHTELSENAKKLMSASKDCAMQLVHKPIGTTHLLIGLLSQDDCNAVKVLKALGKDCGRLRETVKDQLISGGDLD